MTNPFVMRSLGEPSPIAGNPRGARCPTREQRSRGDGLAMGDGLQAKVRDAVQAEIHRLPDLGYKEKRMLQQSDLTAIERFLERRSRSQRRSLWWGILVQPPLVFALFSGALDRFIAADGRPAFIGRMLLVLGATVFSLAVYFKEGLGQLQRTDRVLAYVQLLKDH